MSRSQGVADRGAAELAEAAGDERSLRPLTDEDDLADWEVVADGADGTLSLVVSVEVEPPYAREIVLAAHRDGMNVQHYLQRSVRELGESLRQRMTVSVA